MEATRVGPRPPDPHAEVSARRMTPRAARGRGTGLFLAALLPLALLAGTGCDLLASSADATPTPGVQPTPTPQHATVQVRRGTIVDAIKVLGRVVSSREADLSFRNTGRIRDVFVQPGDMVKEGQVLAELDQKDLPWTLAKARVTVEQAQVKLAAAQAKDVVDDTPLDRLAIRAAQISLAQALLNVQRLQAGPLPADARKAEADVAAGQAALDKAHYDLQDKQVTLAAKQAELDILQQGPDPLALLQAKADVDTAKIKVEQLQAGPRPEDVRAAEIALDQERTKLDQVHDQPRVRAQELANAKTDADLASAKLAKVLADIDAGQLKGEEARANAVKAAQLDQERAQNNYTAKVNAADPTPDEIRAQEQAVQLRQLELDKVKNQPSYDLDGARADLTAKQAKLDQLQAGPQDSEIAARTAEIQAQQIAVENAKQTIAAAEANRKAAQAKLDLVQSGPTDFQLRDANNQVALARNQIETSQTKLQANQDAIAQKRGVAAYDGEQQRRAIAQAVLDVQNYEAQTGDVKIVAPFDGRITRLAARPGDNVQAFFPILNVSSLEGLVVKADIAEADVPRLQVGMPVDLTLDVYPNQKLTGRVDALPEQTVGQVGQAPDRSTRVVVDWPGPGAEMGMLARVQITLQIKPDVLIVPNGAVKTVGKRKYVEYMDGDIKRSRNVETGITTDQDTEVTSGLQEGMTILAGDTSSSDTSGGTGG
jgi:RND family efflux transporter MFP subunit